MKTEGYLGGSPLSSEPSHLPIPAPELPAAEKVYLELSTIWKQQNPNVRMIPDQVKTTLREQADLLLQARMSGPLPFSQEDLAYFEEHPGEVYAELDSKQHSQIEEPVPQTTPSGDYDSLEI